MSSTDRRSIRIPLIGAAFLVSLWTFAEMRGTLARFEHYVQGSGGARVSLGVGEALIVAALVAANLALRGAARRYGPPAPGLRRAHLFATAAHVGVVLLCLVLSFRIPDAVGVTAVLLAAFLPIQLFFVLATIILRIAKRTVASR